MLYDRKVLLPVEQSISRRTCWVGMDDDGREVDEAVNGEVIRTELERYRKGNLVKAGIVGVAFFVGVVGNWGDGWAGYGL